MRYVAFLLLAGLAGCGVWTSTIRSDVLDYNSVVTDTIDKYLLVNVLEARDNAPLHFVEMPKISGTLQATASLQGSLPISAHPVHNGTGIATDTLTPNVGVSSTPTFEVDNLDTKEFAAGSTSPIDLKQIQYWYDKGTDHRLLLLLFFSSLQITQYGCEAPGEPRKVSVPQTADSKKQGNGPATAGADAQKRADDLAKKQTDDFAKKQTAEFAKKKDEYAACLNNYWTDRPASKEIAYTACHWPNQTLPKPSGLERCMMDKAENDAKYDRVIELRNDPRAAIDNRPLGLASFGDYLSIVGKISPQFAIHSYSEENLLAENIPIGATDLSKFDLTKYSLTYQHVNSRNGEPIFDVYSVPANMSTVYCYGSVALTDKPRSDSDGGSENECSQPTIRNSDAALQAAREVRPVARTLQACSDPAQDLFCEILVGYRGELGRVVKNEPVPFGSPRYSIGLNTRSAGGMVRYLGDILYYQDHPPSDFSHNGYFTLGFDRDCHASPAAANKSPGAVSQMCLLADGGYLFVVDPPTPPQVGGAGLLCHADEKQRPRILVNYQDKTYAVAESSPCDNTLAVLAVVSHAINLNKSASDIRITPLLQAVP